MVSALPERMDTTVKEYGCVPFDTKSSIGMHSKIVHDLGVVGDDFTDFYEILSKIYCSKNLVPEHYIPSELSADAYYIAMARSFPIRNIEYIRDWYLSRIKCPALSLKDLHVLMLKCD